MDKAPINSHFLPHAQASSTHALDMSRRDVLGLGSGCLASSFVGGSLSLAYAPEALAQAPKPLLGHAIVLNSRDASLSLIDRISFKEVGRVDVGKEPHHLYPTPDQKMLIVANAVSNDLHFVDPYDGKVIGRIRGIDDPYQLAYTPDGKWFACAALRLNRVDIYSVQAAGSDAGLPSLKLSKRVSLAKAPSHVWFSTDGRWLFTTLQESHDIAAIDMQSQTVAWRLPVGKLPAGIMLTPGDQLLLIGVMGEDYVNVVDWRAQKSIAKIKTGAGAHNFRGAGDQRHVYVSNRVAGTVSRVDMKELRVVDQMLVPGGPDCMELTEDKKQLWITTRWEKKVVVMDTQTRKLIASIPVGRSPHGIFFAPRAPLL